MPSRRVPPPPGARPVGTRPDTPADSTAGPARTGPATGGRHGLASLPPGRSPLIALVMLLGAGALATGMAAGRPALAAAVLVVQLVLGLCWLTLLQATLATGSLVGLAALACDSLLLRTERADAGSVAGVIGLAFLAAIGSQLLRRGRREVTAGIAAALSGVVLVASAALILPLRQFASGREIALTALVATAVALVGARLVPGPGLVIRGGSLLVAVVVGARFGATVQDLSTVTALTTAALAGLVALVIDLGVLRLSGTVGRRQLPALRPVAALLPVVATLPVVYVIGWIVGQAGT
ncbi:MAG: hypothetical protein QOC80_2662 [Frankiaceae bacterium]|nr:hypothetical protein [Frankiaceae bacterium]